MLPSCFGWKGLRDRGNGLPKSKKSQQPPHWKDMSDFWSGHSAPMDSRSTQAASPCFHRQMRRKSFCSPRDPLLGVANSPLSFVDELQKKGGRVANRTGSLRNRVRWLRAFGSVRASVGNRRDCCPCAYPLTPAPYTPRLGWYYLHHTSLALRQTFLLLSKLLMGSHSVGILSRENYLKQANGT